MKKNDLFIKAMLFMARNDEEILEEIKKIKDDKNFEKKLEEIIKKYETRNIE